jgi:hypothetical protein
MVAILIENEEVRLLLYNVKELVSLSFNRVVPSVPDLGGSLQAVEG